MKIKNFLFLFFVLLITTICGLPDINGNTIKVKGTIRGNGKTLSMTYFLFADYVKQKRQIYTNYKTTFSKCLNAKQLLNLVYQSDLENVSIGLDEIQTIVNSMGEKKEKAEFVTMLYNQARKKSIDIYQTVQRERDIFNRVRLQRDYTLVPKKYHLLSEDNINNKFNVPCNLDRCNKKHFIKLTMYYPYYQVMPLIILCDKVGALYNTKEIIKDSFK